MDNNQPGYRYPSIEMRESPDRKIWWLMGAVILTTLFIFLFSKSNQNNLQVQPSYTFKSNLCLSCYGNELYFRCVELTFTKAV